MSSKQERFVVRICGCCRGLDRFLTLTATSRVNAIQLVERIGIIMNRSTVREFLEGNSTSRADSFYFYSETAAACNTIGARRHSAIVFNIDE